MSEDGEPKTRDALGRFPKGAGGRPKGIPNKTTRTALEAIALAAEALGGHKRLGEWAKEAPENEKAFWSTIYPKLLPLQVTGKDGGAIKTDSVVEVAMRPQLTKEEWLIAHGVGTAARTTD